eukprot:13062868-Alexandrium_andersonii.AAC.1
MRRCACACVHCATGLSTRNARALACTITYVLWCETDSSQQLHLVVAPVAVQLSGGLKQGARVEHPKAAEQTFVEHPPDPASSKGQG